MLSAILSRDLILNSISKIFLIKPQHLITNENLSPLKRRVLRKILENSYKRNFETLNFKLAYRDKILLAIAYSRGYFYHYTTEAKNYLSIIGHDDFLQFLDLENSIIKEIKEVKNIFHFEDVKKRFFFKNIIFLGPSAQEKDFLDLDNYDLVVCNKPPKKKLKISSSKILLILNNIYSQKRSDEILAWVKENPEATIISQQDISEDLVSDDVFELLPSFLPLASPMGLQRALFVLAHTCYFEKIELRGFNFSLSSDPYNNWYPSMMKDSSKSNFHKSIIQSNLVHDLVFNILFIRSMSKNIKVLTGEAVELSQKNIKENLDKFNELYSN